MIATTQFTCEKSKESDEMLKDDDIADDGSMLFRGTYSAKRRGMPSVLADARM